MLIVILIDVHYLQNALFSFEKSLNGQNQYLSGSHHPIPPPLPSKIPLCLNTILKTLIKLHYRGSSRLSQAVQAEVAEILNNINKVSSADLTMVGVRDHERL